jgi:translation initiation factor IF-1
MRSSVKTGVTQSRPGEDEKETSIEVIGMVVEKFRAGMFSLQLEGGQNVLATLADDARNVVVICASR